MKAFDEVLKIAHQKILAANFEKSESFWVKKLAGDASLRRYFRVYDDDRSFVLMCTEAFQPDRYDFLLVRAHLEKSRIPVPKLLSLDGAKGAILLEDLGDETMLHRLGSVNDKATELDFFKEALKLLSSFHQDTRAPSGEMPVPGYGLAFDEAKLMWEVDFTLKHFFSSYLKRDLSEKYFLILRSSFEDICRRLAAEPRVFTHRDFHSRNIMVTGQKKMVCIDFQDARMGPRAYDLASILRDSYYQLSEDSIYDLVDYYYSMVHGGGCGTKDHFVRLFDLMSIQRNFKAIGSFTSFYANRSDASYLRFVGNTFENIRRNLEKFSEYRDMKTVLFQSYYF